LAQQTNSCGGLDHRVNGLGTCKHNEGIIAAMLRGWVKELTHSQDDGRRGGAWIAADPVYLQSRGRPGRGFEAVCEQLAADLTADGTLTHSRERIENLIAGGKLHRRESAGILSSTSHRDHTPTSGR
jgi:hypothetical protein